MTTTQHTHEPAARARRVPTRRASVILLAVGVLAVLAVVAVSYTAAVRIERAAVRNAVTAVDSERAVEIVVDEIGDNLAADLFGNKLVELDTPPGLLSPSAAQYETTSLVWPRMFEDGEFFDYPRLVGFDPNQTINYHFRVDNPGSGQPNDESILFYNLGLGRFSVAPEMDDAWLASIEPVSRAGDPQRWDTWPQVTNLRQMYRWSRVDQYFGYPNPAVDGHTWVRDTGTFADLGQFFLGGLSTDARRGDPDADLEDFEEIASWAPGNLQDNGPALGREQRVFAHQMAALEELYSFGNPDVNPDPVDPTDDGVVFERVDTRFWADTDGDGRPDARWQRLPELDGLNGLRWVAAVRITDNSARVNVNTALEAGSPTDDQNNTFVMPTAPSVFKPDAYYGEDAFNSTAWGRSPLDVDLRRLLLNARFGPDEVAPSLAWGDAIDNANSYASVPGGYANVFRAQHEETQLRLRDIVRELNTLTPDNSDDLGQWAGTLPTTRAQREAVWKERLAVSSPFGLSGAHYPIDDEIDLRTYASINREDTTSSIEQRLDAGRLRGQDLANDPPLLGPLRAGMPFTDARSFDAIPPYDDPNGVLAVRPTFEEIRDDIRRHLTTISGRSQISPVPVLNRAVDTIAGDTSLVYGESTGVERVRLDQFPRGANDYTSDAANVNRFLQVRAAFEQLVFALAPLATDVPLMPPLIPANMGDGGDGPGGSRPGAESQAFHYGGSSVGATLKGPAAALQIAAGGVDPGATYAVLRAASLAVNLADASDFDGVLPASPSSQAIDSPQPTIARFFPTALAPELLTRQNPPVNGNVSASNAAGVLELGAAFAHGNIGAPPPGTAATTLLPQQYVGLPQDGITLVGLDRQPFLREVATLAVYQEDGADGTGGDDQIDSGGEQLGSLVMIELGNPWPEPIDVDRYGLILRSGTGAGDEEVKIYFSGVGGTGIDPGATKIFIAEWGSSADWITARDAYLGSEAGDKVVFGGPGGLATVAFQSLGEAVMAPVVPLLVFDPDGAGGAAPPVLVDRLSPPNASLDRFPAVLSGVLTLPNMSTGRYAVASSLRRPTENGGTSGFPGYVIERRETNTLGFMERQVDWPDTDPPQTADGVVSGLAAATLIGEEKGSIVNAGMPMLTMTPDFQLVVPNHRLESVADIGLICAFTHMYIHGGTGAYVEGDLHYAADPAIQFGPNAWRTVSEQLGDPWNLFADSEGLIGEPSRSLGMLDFSRYTLTDSFGSGDLEPLALSVRVPEPLAIPLAARIFDGFDADTAAGTLLPGVVNLNTAPVRVLRTLPFVSPEEDLGEDTMGPMAGPLPAAGIAAVQNETDRAGLLRDYREAMFLGSASNVSQRAQLTGLRGLRSIGNPSNANAPLPAFAALGEASLLTFWNRGSVNPTGAEIGHVDLMIGYGEDFGSLAHGVALNNDETFNNGLIGGGQVTPDNQRVDGVLDRLPNYESGGVTFDPVDDQEERLAIFRGLANAASVRSDVYTATFIIRGYDPARIRAIPIPADILNNDEARARLLNQLEPTHESRWLAVFDRSNIVAPTDRPRLLLLTRLPD